MILKSIREIEMDRRKFLVAAASVPVVLLIPQVGWSETLPCGQVVRYTTEYHDFFGDDIEWVVGRMERRGIEYALKCVKVVNDHPLMSYTWDSLEKRLESLRHSLSATCFQVDIRDGLATEADAHKYFDS